MRKAARLLCLVALVGLWPLAAPAQQRINAKLDEFGNPIGKGHSLASDGAFRGKRLLVWSSDSGSQPIMADSNPLWPALEAKGFAITRQSGPFQPEWLKEADQLWIFCGIADGLGVEGQQAVEQFVRRGKGLYVAADNAPYLAEADALAQKLFNSTVSGDYAGAKIVAVRGKGVTREDNQRGRSGGGGKSKESGDDAPQGAGAPRDLPGLGARLEIIDQTSHYVNDHALLTGINYLYEGITISHLTASKSLDVVLTASDGQILASVSKLPGQRVILDCGFTRYYPDYISTTAGTLRYAENVAAWLMGKGGGAGGAGGTVMDLLASLASDDAKTKRDAAGKLARQQPKYKDVKDQLAEIWKLARSKEPQVAKAARGLVEQAFLRAPISECLRWLGQADPELRKLIWRQVDDRIERADAERKAGYRETGLKTLADGEAALPVRQAAAQLLARLKDRQAAEPLVELLGQAPRALRSDVSEALRACTGQDFGPRTGEGTAELAVALKQWRKWLADNAKAAMP